MIAAVAAFVPLDPARVDRFYSRTFYALLQPLVTSVSSLVPLALVDFLLVGALIWLVLRIARAWRSGDRARMALRLAGDLAAGVAIVYLLFVVLWGLNYRRLPVTSGLDFEKARVNGAAVDSLAERTVQELNRLSSPAHAMLAAEPSLSAVRVRLAPAFAEAQRALGAAHLATAGRPKVSILSPFFRLASVDGMINPLGLEVLVNPEVLPVERPFVVAHEWGHLAGWARESEASFVGWVTCLQGDELARYSAWLDLYFRVSGDLPPARARVIASDLGEGPRRDLVAINARLAHAQPVLQRASWAVYDRFLKANRVPEGIRSYDEAVTLLAGTRFDPTGKPVLLR